MYVVIEHLFNNYGTFAFLENLQKLLKPPRVITAATLINSSLHTYVEVHFAGGVKVTGTRKESPYGLKMTEHGSVGAHGLF